MEGGNPEASIQLLKQKYDLHKSPEVTAAANRTEAHTGEPISQDPLDRIQNYLNRFREITDREDPEERTHGIEAIKRLLHKKYVIKQDEIPDSYWETQRRIRRERGQPNLENQDWEEFKTQNTEVIIADQTSSMDKWIDYLSSPQALYPDAFKYWALRSVLNLGEYDKGKKQFPQRSRGTTKPFPDLNSEALAYVMDGLEKKYGPEYFQISQQIDTTEVAITNAKSYEKKIAILNGIQDDARVHEIEWNGKKIQIKKKDAEKLKATLKVPDNQEVSQLSEKLEALRAERLQILKDKELPDEFLDLPEDENFSKLYAFAMEKITPATTEALTNTTGQWIKYNQGSDHMPLVASLQGHGTGWCTAGESTAQKQLDQGDFYVYYSNDRDNKSTIPRIAIRMVGGNIDEVRGIAPDQNLDPFVAPIVEQKLKEFPDGDAYNKKVSDMKHLTEIDNKMQNGIGLNKEDIVFLYEMDSLIEGFGGTSDPRIKLLRDQREQDQDLSIFLDCNISEIAHNLEELKPGIKAYLGPLIPGIFDKLKMYNIENIYTRFPYIEVQRRHVEIGGKSKEQLQNEIKQSGMHVSRETNEIINNPNFTTLQNRQEIDCVILSINALGVHDYLTIDQIYKRAEELGLYICPPEVGLHLRLQYSDQPMNQNFKIAMNQFPTWQYNTNVLAIRSSQNGLWLDPSLMFSGYRYPPGDKFAFSLTKFETPIFEYPEAPKSAEPSHTPLRDFFRKLLKR